MRTSRLLRWLNRTPVQTFILCPLLVVGFELVRRHRPSCSRPNRGPRWRSCNIGPRPREERDRRNASSELGLLPPPNQTRACRALLNEWPQAGKPADLLIRNSEARPRNDALRLDTDDIERSFHE